MLRRHAPTRYLARGVGPLPPGRDGVEADVMGARYGSVPAVRRPTDFAKNAESGRNPRSQLQAAARRIAPRERRGPGVW
jgi:hypothetical protein